MRRALLNFSEKGSGEQQPQQAHKHLLFQGMFTALLQEELEGGCGLYESGQETFFFFSTWFFFPLETMGFCHRIWRSGCLKSLQCLSSQHLLCANVIPPAALLDVSSCTFCFSYRVSIGHPNDAITTNLLLGSESLQCKQDLASTEESMFAAVKERRGTLFCLLSNVATLCLKCPRQHTPWCVFESSTVVYKDITSLGSHASITGKHLCLLVSLSESLCSQKQPQGRSCIQIVSTPAVHVQRRHCSIPVLSTGFSRNLNEPPTALEALFFNRGSYSDCGIEECVYTLLNMHVLSVRHKISMSIM